MQISYVRNHSGTKQPYEEGLSVIRGYLLTVDERKQEFTFNSELKLTDTLLTTFETKQHTLKQILPKLDPRRRVINFGGAMLKTGGAMLKTWRHRN